MDTGAGINFFLNFAGTNFADFCASLFVASQSQLPQLRKSSPCLFTIGSAKVEVSLVSAKVSSMQIRPTSVRLVQLNFGLSLYLDRTFGLSLSLSLSLSRNFGLRPKFGLSERLSEITSLFDLSLVLDRTLAQRKAKSKSEVAQCPDLSCAKRTCSRHVRWATSEWSVLWVQTAAAWDWCELSSSRQLRAVRGCSLCYSLYLLFRLLWQEASGLVWWQQRCYSQSAEIQKRGSRSNTAQSKLCSITW